MNRKIEYFFNFILALFPKGKLWNFGKNFRILLKIIAKELVKIKDYLDDFSRESIPYLAQDTIPEWLEQYGISNTNDIISNKNLIDIYASAVGGSNVGYLENLLKNRYPNLKLKFNENYSAVELDGIINSRIEELMVFDFLEKVFPAYVFIILKADVIEDYGQYAICNKAITGVAKCGYFIYNEQLYYDGRYANCGIAQSGVATCGYQYSVLIDKTLGGGGGITLLPSY